MLYCVRLFLFDCLVFFFFSLGYIQFWYHLEVYDILHNFLFLLLFFGGVYIYLRLHECASAKKKRRKKKKNISIFLIILLVFEWVFCVFEGLFSLVETVAYVCVCDCITIRTCFSHCIPEWACVWWMCIGFYFFYEEWNANIHQYFVIDSSMVLGLWLFRWRSKITLNALWRIFIMFNTNFVKIPLRKKKILGLGDGATSR